MKYNDTQTYGDLVQVDILDYGGNNQKFTNWPHGSVITGYSNKELFNDKNFDDYAIMSGDHFTFIGNECMLNWQHPNQASHEAFAMKTDFPLVYSTQNYGFAPNGYWKLNKNDLNMPTQYYLYNNYNDKIQSVQEGTKSKKINNQADIGIQYENSIYYG